MGSEDRKSSMSTQERMEELVELTGLSESIVRRVLNAERTSMVNSLKRGERATLGGRVTVKPKVCSKVVNGKEVFYIKPVAEVSYGVKQELESMEEFVKPQVEQENEEIKLYQIESLV